MLTSLSLLFIIAIFNLLLYKKHPKPILSLFSVLFISVMILTACTNEIDNEPTHLHPSNDTVSNHETVENYDITADDRTEVQAEEKEEVNNVENIVEPEKEKKAEKKKPKQLPDLKVHFIDVGQADAALIEVGEYHVLIDSGDWMGNETVDYLNAKAIDEIDLIVGSHPHADHIGQIDKIIEQFEVGEVWMSGDTTTSKVFERVMTAIDDYGIGYDEPRAGDHYEIGDMTIDIFSPSTLNGNLNDDSIVLKLTYGTVSFLFTGDAEKNAESQMLNHDYPLESTILKVGHHGSNTSNTASFIEAINPVVAVISVAEKSKYSHPDQSVLDTLNSNDIDLYATKSHGNIVITTDGKKYDIETDRSEKVTAGVKKAKEKKTSKKKKKAPATEKKADPPDNNSTCVDINSASEGEVQNIIHIGPARAVDLIDLRPYNSVDDLVRIKGIAAKRIEDIKAQGIACVK